MAGRITKQRVDALGPGETIWDSELHGFGVRRVKGTPFFVAKYRSGHGRSARQRWITIGALGAPWTTETARAEAKIILGKAASGGDPAAHRDHKNQVLTFRDMALRFLDEHVTPKRRSSTARDYRRLLETFALPQLGSMKIDSLNRADMAKLDTSKNLLISRGI